MGQGARRFRNYPARGHRKSGISLTPLGFEHIFHCITVVVAPFTRGKYMRLSRFLKIAFLLSAATLLPLIPAHGQALKGTVLGTVTDASHAVVPGVAVNVTEINTNFRRSEVSNESGFFAFANLDPGDYRIEVSHQGFRKVVRAGIALEANSTVRVDLELTPGDVTQVVDVTSEAP